MNKEELLEEKKYLEYLYQEKRNELYSTDKDSYEEFYLNLSKEVYIIERIIQRINDILEDILI